MKHTVLYSCLLMAIGGVASAQTYSDLGHALYARGYTTTVWVNSFDPTQPHLGHGGLYPDVPIVVGYDDRYGMTITGSGTPSQAGSLIDAQGTAHNPNANAADGSILIELFRNGSYTDGALLPFFCGPFSDCPWSAHFATTWAAGVTWTVRVSRHVQGSLVGERHIDLNGVCRNTLVSYFGLPGGYTFTATDDLDAQYTADKALPDRSVTDTVLIPLCSGVKPTPVSSFTWTPTAVFPNTVVTFTDTSAGLPTAWSWTFQGGSITSSHAPNPQVSWSTTGDKVVTLTASNSSGSGGVATRTVKVIDPNPQGTLTAAPTSPTQCQAVTFTANVTGALPLTYTWEVLDTNGFVLAPGAVGGGATFGWTSAPGQAPGTYTGRVTVRNSFNPTGLVLTRAVQLGALPALTDISGAAPTVTTGFISNTVQLQAPTFAGATLVVWDYGDGTTESFTDLQAGSGPVHTYATNGTFNAKVTISSCVNPTGSTSQSVSVPIGGSGSLHAGFQASDISCQFGQCSFTVGQNVSFVDSSTGAAFWDYDWSHTSTSAQTCSFTDSGHAVPVTSHVFGTAGTFYPCLRVRSATGGQSVAVHGTIVVGGSPAAAVAVSGPSSGQVNQQLTFNATASNCSPSPTGWSWTAGGGTITGGATGSSVVASWSSAGSKVVTATNSACTGATGSRTVTISATPPTTPQAAFTFTPASPKIGDPVTFDASSSTNVAAGSVYGWELGDGATASGTVVLHAFASAATFSVRLTITPPGCTTTTCKVQATKTVTVGSSGGPQWSVAPAAPEATEDALFDGRSSTQVVPGSAFWWAFEDGSQPGFGPVLFHVFPKAGTYNVTLGIVPPGCSSPACSAYKAKTLVVGPPPLVTARFTPDVLCAQQGAVDSCQARTAKAVAFTAVDPDAGAYAWSFGDGSTGAGRQVSHTWQAPGSYAVTLTATQGTASASKTRTFVVTGAAPPKNKRVLLPFIFESTGPLLQSSDLYIYNPGGSTLELALELRLRGASPTAEPPRQSTVLPQGASYYMPDVLRRVFNRENVAGFITVTAMSETVEPIVTAVDTSGQTSKRIFGRAVQGATLPAANTSAASTTGPSSPQHLVGLSDSAERQASLGLSNPGDTAATYRLKFFDSDGHFLIQSGELLLGAYSQTELSTQALREAYGMGGRTDYRVEVESVGGPPLFPYAADLRLASGDPSFITPSPYTAGRVYLLGVATGPGLGGKVQTDLLLTNVSGIAGQASVSFLPASTKAAATPGPLTVPLPAGATRRLVNVLGTLGSKSGAGVLTVNATASDGTYPIALAETYDNTNPKKRFGQTIMPLTDADAAAVGGRVLLVGLRQDRNNKTTLWLLNASGEAGEYDLVYRGLDGTVLGTLQGVKVAAGAVRQLAASNHPFPKPGPINGFVVEVKVKSGNALAAAQVMRLGSNDPTWVRGVPH